MITYEFALNRLQEIATLPEGWHFNEGKSMDPISIKEASSFLDFAKKAGLEEMEVFPGTDGFVDVHFYNRDRTLELRCFPHSVFVRERDESDKYTSQGEIVPFKQALSAILIFATCRSSDSSTLSIGPLKRNDTVLVLVGSNQWAVGSPSSVDPAPKPTAPKIQKKSPIGSFDSIHPSHPAYKSSYGNWMLGDFLKESNSDSLSQPQETSATTI